MRLGLIGFGAIGQAIADRLAREGAERELVGALVRRIPAAPSAVPLFTSLDELLRREPGIIIEAAGHEALLAYGPAIVQAGVDLVISSVGALAAPSAIAALTGAGGQGGRVLVSSGAIAGLDGLLAAQIAGLERVLYTSYKPPAAWRGTMAEQLCDLDAAYEEFTFFAGSARRAAMDFPKNANVSAAIALAGLGFDRTEIKLVSSRKVDGPLGVIEAWGAFGWFKFEIFAAAFPSNPKSSMLTAYALLQSARLGLGIPLDRVAAR